MSTLFEIDEHLQLLLEARSQLLDEIGDREADPHADADTFREIETREHLLKDADADIARYTESMLAKVDGTAAVIRNLLAVAETCKAEAQRIARRGKQAEADADYLKALVLSLMEQKGEKKLKGKFSTFTAAGNGGVAPLVISQPDLVPTGYKRVVISLDADQFEDFAAQFVGHFDLVRGAEPNNPAIRAALEAGEGVPGAHIEARGKHLRIS